MKEIEILYYNTGATVSTSPQGTKFNIWTDGVLSEVNSFSVGRTPLQLGYGYSPLWTKNPDVANMFGVELRSGGSPYTGVSGFDARQIESSASISTYTTTVVKPSGIGAAKSNIGILIALGAAIVLGYVLFRGKK